MSDTPRTSPAITLLIVEDCTVTLQCYSSILAMLCPEITLYTASDGTSGLELFKEHLPQIVVTDLNMPEMDGRQLTANIRAIRPETKLIILTGDKESVDRHGKVSVYDYLIGKPVDFQDLFAAIKQCIDDVEHHGA